MPRPPNLLAYVLIGAGAVLVFQGAREVFDSRFGQSEAGRQFRQDSEQEIPASAASRVSREAPAPGSTVAQLLIPRLDSQLYVVEGVGKSELRLGPGHMSGTAMPGSDGNCVIAGHRDTHFRILKDIRKGDDIVLKTRSGEYLYRVTGLRIVPPTNTAALKPTAGAELHLITCYPFYYVGSAPKRFVVEAELAGSVAAASPDESGGKSGS